MTRWIAAALVGLVVGWIGYAGAVRRGGAFGWLAAARVVASMLIAAVALGAPVPGVAPRAAIVAFDASASWTRGADAGAARAAADTARRVAAAARTLVAAVGESARAVGRAPGSLPLTDRLTRVRGVADSAATTGLPLVLVTDGEVDDGDALARVPAGSRAVVVRPPRAADAAVTNVEAPASVAPGDTAMVSVSIAADTAGAGAGRVDVRLDAGRVVERATPALGPYGRATIAVRLPIASDPRAHTAVLEAVVTTAGDREPRNDTARRAVDVTAAPRAVIVSTAPDYDVGLALSVLRGALAVPVRAYYRVAPGTWRVAGTLAPATEADVRAAAASAGLLVLHGDTAAFGNPRGIGRGALALAPVGDAGDSTTDWYAAPGTSPGPLAVLASLPWDSLPPLDVAAASADARGALGQLSAPWTAVVARAGRRGPARALVSGGTDASGRRIAVVAGSGFWRWAFRGGAGAVAAPAVWGALFDWLADTPEGATRAVTPADAFIQSGAQIHWRGIGARDTAVRIQLTRRGAGARVTLVARRAAAGGEASSDSPAPGVYDLAGGGVLVVNASAELLPRRPTVRSGLVGATRAAAPPSTEPIAPGWPLALATLLLCAEWVTRRRLGLR